MGKASGRAGGRAGESAGAASLNSIMHSAAMSQNEQMSQANMFQLSNVLSESLHGHTLQSLLPHLLGAQQSSLLLPPLPISSPHGDVQQQQQMMKNCGMGNVSNMSGQIHQSTTSNGNQLNNLMADHFAQQQLQLRQSKGSLDGCYPFHSHQPSLHAMANNVPQSFFSTMHGCNAFQNLAASQTSQASAEIFYKAAVQQLSNNGMDLSGMAAAQAGVQGMVNNAQGNAAIKLGAHYVQNVGAQEAESERDSEEEDGGIQRDDRKEARREYHKRIERKRRDRMNALYDTLRSLTNPTEPADKNAVLQGAVNLIQELKRENSELTMQQHAHSLSSHRSSQFSNSDRSDSDDSNNSTCSNNNSNSSSGTNESSRRYDSSSTTSTVVQTKRDEILVKEESKKDPGRVKKSPRDGGESTVQPSKRVKL